MLSSRPAYLGGIFVGTSIGDEVYRKVGVIFLRPIWFAQTDGVGAHLSDGEKAVSTLSHALHERPVSMRDLIGVRWLQKSGALGWGGVPCS